MNKRQDGYYWVKYKEDSDWAIGYYKNIRNGIWYFNFHTFEFFSGTDTVPFEVYETPILNPNNQ